MKQIKFNIIILVFYMSATFLSYAQTSDSCNVKEYVRHDGLMIRGMQFETIYTVDSINIMCAMYAVDKDYFLVLHIDDIKKMAQGENLHDDLSIQLSDSTVVLLTYNANKSQSSKKAYDGYFKIHSKDLGYIEKYSLVRVNYVINNQKYFLVTQNQDILQRHFSCLLKK